jgi:hypothetical protein
LIYIKAADDDRRVLRLQRARGGEFFAVPRRREAMIRLLAIVFALVLASSAQGMPRAPLQQPDEMVIKVRQACGPGMHYVNGACIRTPARRAASRCARGVTC